MHRSFLAKSWFCCFFLIKSQFKNVWKNGFSTCWQDLGLAGCFFLSKFYFKKYWKFDFSSIWQDLGFTVAGFFG